MSIGIAYGPQLFVTIKRVTHGGIQSVPHVIPEKWAQRCQEEILNGWPARSPAARPIDKATIVVLAGGTTKATPPVTSSEVPEIGIADKERQDVGNLTSLIKIVSPKPRYAALLGNPGKEDRYQQQTFSQEGPL